MILSELIAELKRRNIKISIQSNNLKINASDSALDDELIQNIKLFKKELIAILGGINKNEESYISCSQKKQFYPLSPAQRRMYLLQGINPSSIAYNIPLTLPLQPGFEIKRLEGVLHAMIQRHESFRTSFHLLGESVVQRVHDIYTFSVGFKSVNPDDVDRALIAFTQPFDLAQHPLLRATILDVVGENPLLLLDMHHIISDGVSQGVLAAEFNQLYREELLRPLRLQYKDFAEWQQGAVYQASLKGQQRYWEEHWAGEFPVLDLPLDVSRSRAAGKRGKWVSFSVNDDLTGQIKQICQREGLTLYMFLLGAFKILLSKLSGQEDLLVGSPTSGRRHSSLEGIIGMFVNTLVLRSFPCAEKRVDTYMQELKQEVLSAFENQDYPYEELVEYLQPNREVGRNPLFDVMFVLQNQKESVKGEWVLGQINFQPGVSKFDLMLQAVDGESCLLFTYEYSSIFEDETIKRFVGYYKELLSGLTASYEDRIADIRMISEQERSKLLCEFNSTKQIYPQEKTLIELLDDQVGQSGDRMALVCEDQWLSYWELNQNANQLANHLRQRGVCRHSVIGVMFDESLQGIVSILSILKAGGIYMPISPQYPTERQTYLVKNSDCSLLLISKVFEASSGGFKGTDDIDKIYVDRALYQIEPREFECVKRDGDDVAYIMHTSGTSGTPKGVLVSHQNVVRLVKGTNYISFNERDRILQTGALEFDASTFEIWGALLNGLALILISKEKLLLPHELKRAITRYSVSTMWLTSSLFNFFADSDLSLFSGLFKLLVGGDVLSRSHISRLQEAHPSIEVINGYGPTENTTFSTTCKIDKNREIIPIGKPIANSTAYIVDHSDRFCPIGVYGELLVGGDGLSRGYLNDPELTASKYSLSFNGLGVLYRTGDVARWLPDGNIEFRGRKDDQVKIRGFRVEPREVERFIGRIDGVKDVYVNVLERSSGKELCAYYTSEKEYGQDWLREVLNEVLPTYMIPSYFVRVASMPLTANGKVDRKALPEPMNTLEVVDSLDIKGSVLNKLKCICSEILGKEMSGINASSNFFHIGGHSLKAAILVGRIKKEFNVDISIKDVFQKSEVGLIAQHILSAKTKEFTSVRNAEKKQYYPLSPAQRRMFLLQEMYPSSVVYNMPISFPLELGSGIEKIERVLRTLIDRHESFRTSFHVHGEIPVQRIHDEYHFSVERKIVSPDDVEREKAAFTKPFNLSCYPLLHVTILDVPGESPLLLLDMHHIISDGVSQSILASEFERLYLGASLLPLRLQYKDYSEWQNSHEYQIKVKEQGDYWVNQFERAIPVMSLPVDYIRPVVQNYEGAAVNFVLSKEETENIKRLTEINGLTLYMSVFSVFGILLSKLSGQEDIVIGTPVAGRNHADLEQIVGVFVNTLAIRNEVKGSLSIQKFITQVRQTVIESFEHQEYQFEDLVERISVNRDIARNPVFDVMFNMLNQKDYSGDLSELDTQEQVHTSGISKFDLILTAVDCGEQLLFNIEYCTKLFKPESIERYIRYFRRIAAEMTRKPELPICEVELLSSEEKHQLLHAFNDTEVEYPRNKTIIQLFEEQIEKTPDRIAVSLGDHHLTYQELNEISSQIAAYLQENNLGSGGVIGLLYDRNEVMIVTILAILKTGNAYLPIDTNYPKERVTLLLNDCNISHVVSQIDYVNNIEGRYKVIEIDVNEVAINGYRLSPCKTNSSDVAYIMYTSGSSGGPKGVLVENRSVVRLVKNQNYVVFDKSDRILQTGAPAFDATTFEIWGALLNGGSLHLVPYETITNPVKIAETLCRNCISILWLTSALFNQICDADESMFYNLKYLLVGGDVLSPKHINKAKRANKRLKIINGYGPTENTTFSTCYQINQEFEHDIPIGSPIHNSVAYVLDLNGKLQPIGLAGELYVGGDGVSRGYLNNPELTHEKFIKHPFKEGERLYRTGDKACWLPDGNLLFLGRLDNQVKVRGFRIELSEIENTIIRYEGVKESLVVALEKNGDKYLCAYVVSAEEVDRDALRNYLSARLPEYMVPSYYVQLEQLPLTSNGKVDRRSLPLPEYKIDSNYIAPSNNVEVLLAQIWSEVLNIPKEKIGATADFFNIGGHSLKATVLVGKIHRTFGVEFPLREVFIHSTIIAQAIRIRESSKIAFVSIPKAKKRDYYPLSSAQKRLYLLQQIDLDSTVYNMPYSIPLAIGVDKSRVEAVFRQLISRHESLRTSFEVIGEVPIQRVHEIVDFKVEVFVIERSEKPYLRNRFIRAFDLSQAPLLRVAIVEIIGEGSMLMLDMHHIISDGVSQGILEQEFQQLFQGLELPPLRIQYKDYCEWQNSEYRLPRIKEQELYWSKKFETEAVALNLPTDYIRPVVQSHEGTTVRFVLSKNETTNIKLLAESNGLTLNMSLLSVFTLLLSKLSGQTDIVVGIPIAGRMHTDLENIVGMFVNTLAIRSEVKGGDSLKEFVSGLKQTMLEAYENQDYQFEDLVDKVVVNRDASRNPLFDVMFNMLNQKEYSGDLSEFDNHKLDFVPSASKFDLTLIALDFGECLALSFEYSSKLFKPSSIERFIGYFKNLVNQIEINSDKKISEFEIIGKDEKQKLLYEFNNEVNTARSADTIQGMFEDQARRNPSKIAVDFGDKAITYEMLDDCSNRLANKLLNEHVVEGEFVGIMLDRSVEMIISMLGVLKSNCAYIPLDRSYPPERINYMIKDSQIRSIITQDRSCDLDNVNLVLFNGLEDLYNYESYRNITYSSDLPSYIIYTSGSTGNPKGVLIRHCEIINTLKWYIEFYGFTFQDSILNLASFSFDSSIESIFGALVSGARLVLIQEEEKLNIPYLVETFLRKKVTYSLFVPRLYQAFLDQIQNNKLYLSKVTVAGDSVIDEIIIKHFNLLPNASLYNEYGPTEGSVCSTVYQFEKDNLKILIGKPINNVQCYVLNEDNGLCVIGQEGELCLYGLGVSQGYLNNPELTNERFVKNRIVNNSVIYRTGDLVRWLPDGNIEFIGRIDKQVKIRGFRIELGEIENTLYKYHDIIENITVCLKDNNNENCICCFYKSNERIAYQKIRLFLSEYLPDYMIPSHFVRIDEIPRLPNGKVNRNAFSFPKSEIDDDYTSPKSELEILMCGIWAEVLGCSRVGIHDNFFKLGGDSIKAIMISSRIQNHGYNIKVKDIFRYPLISELCLTVNATNNAVIPQGEVRGDIYFTPIQKWFFDLKFDSKNHFNHSVMLFCKAGFDKARLRVIIKELTSHHDALRIVFNSDNGAIRQESKSVNDFNFDIEEYDLVGKEDLSVIIQSHSTKLQQSIDLNQGPLIKLGLFKCDEGDHLLIIIHHLVIDGVSWRIFLDDFKKMYSHSGTIDNYKLPLKTVSFKEWCDKQYSYSVSADLLGELPYWSSVKLNDVPALPVDKIKTADYTRLVKDRESISINLTELQTSRLLKNCNHVFNTDINDILLSALALTFYEWAAITKISINLESHGREAMGDEINITRTMGWFTSQFPIVLTLTKPDDIFYSLIEIKEIIRKVPNKGFGYGILRYLTPLEHKDNHQLVGVPDVAFNFLGEFNGSNDDGDVLFSNMPTGTSISPDMPIEQKLELNGIIINKKLQVNFLYNKLEYEKGTMQTIAGLYQKKLLSVIQYCVESKNEILTPSDYLYKDLSIEKLFELKSKYDIEEIAPLSKMQKAILFQIIYNEGSTIFYQQSSYKVNHSLDVNLFKKAIASIISNHQILRANFIYKNVVEPFHVISRMKEADIRVHDLSLLTSEKKDTELANLKALDLKEGFDLGKDCLFRAYLIKLEHQLYEIIFSSHHIMMDGWSYHILMQEFVKIYDNLLNHIDLKGTSTVDFIDYLKWIDKKDFKVSEIFWKKYLDGYEVEVSFPKKHEKNLLNGLSQNKKDRFVFEIRNSQFDMLSKLSKMHETTINTLFQLLWGIILCKYNGKSDCVFGATNSGRPEEISGIDRIVGLFINVLPVRVNFPFDMPFNVFFNKFNDVQKDSTSHQLLPIAEIQQLSSLKQKLIDHVVGFQNYNSVSANQLVNNNLEISHDEDFEHLVYDLMVMVAPTPNLLHVEIFYHPELYGIELIKNIPEHFGDVVSQIYNNQHITFDDIALSNALSKAKATIINNIEGTFNF